MLDLSEIITRAQAAPRQTTDVEVVFDAGVAEELSALRVKQSEINDELGRIQQDLAAAIEQLQDDLRAGDPRPAAAENIAEEQSAPLRATLEQLAAETATVEARAAESVVVFRFTALHAHEWAELCARSIPRDDHPEDAGRDYNMDEVTRLAAARSGVRVTDEATVDIDADTWGQIWATLHRLETRRIREAVWVLNEYSGIAAHTEAVVAARKVLTGRPATTPTSLSTSESAPDASTDGNPPPSPTTSTTTKAA